MRTSTTPAPTTLSLNDVVTALHGAGGVHYIVTQAPVEYRVVNPVTGGVRFQLSRFVQIVDTTTGYKTFTSMEWLTKIS